MFKAFQSTFEAQHNIALERQENMTNPMALLAEMQGETMYFHQTMSQEESGDFVGVVEKEVNGHVENAHWKIVPIE